MKRFFTGNKGHKLRLHVDVVHGMAIDAPSKTVFVEVKKGKRVATTDPVPLVGVSGEGAAAVKGHADFKQTVGLEVTFFQDESGTLEEKLVDFSLRDGETQDKLYKTQVNVSDQVMLDSKQKRPFLLELTQVGNSFWGQR